MNQNIERTTKDVVIFTVNNRLVITNMEKSRDSPYVYN